MIFRGQYDQAKAVEEYFKTRPKTQSKRFYIEAGAWNGEYLSNSLYLEMKLGWKGLLVEPNPQAYKELRAKNRNAISLNACFSVTNRPEKVKFDGADVFGGIKDHPVRDQSIIDLRNGLDNAHRKQYTVQCLPFESVWIALDKPIVDFFSLDVEGAEMDVLKSLPWAEIRIESLLIEVVHGDAGEIERFMRQKGYRVFQKFLDVDILFVLD